MIRLLCLIGLSGFIFCSWEKTPLDFNQCRREGITDRRCRMETERDNLLSFESCLSPEACRIFNAFPRDKKERAMGFADGGNFSPEEAVEMVQAGE